MTIATISISLPDFDQRISHWAAKTVAHVTVDDNPFANRQAVFGVIHNQVVIQRAKIVVAEYLPVISDNEFCKEISALRGERRTLVL